MKPLPIFAVEQLCKVRVYRRKYEYLNWLQLIALGEAGYVHAAW